MGLVFRLAGKIGLDQVATVAPSRWGFAAVASTVNLNVIQQPPGQPAPAPPGQPAPAPAGSSTVTDSLWAHEPATWLRDAGLMIVLGVVFSLLAWWRTRGTRRSVKS